MSATALEIITDGLRLFGIIDQTEDPGAVDIANGVKTLNNMLRSEMADGAAQFLITMLPVTLPAGVQGQIYQFSIGTANANYLIQQDVVGVRQIWMNDLNANVSREIRLGPKTDVVRTLYPGIITKWHQERQSDDSVLITAWQPPRAASSALLELAGRLPAITAADGSDVVALPSEGIHDAKLLFGLKVCTSYGRNPQAVGLMAQDAMKVNERWRTWARGQQWLRYVRS